MSSESHFFYLFENSLLYSSARSTLSGFPILLRIYFSNFLAILVGFGGEAKQKSFSYFMP